MRTPAFLNLCLVALGNEEARLFDAAGSIAALWLMARARKFWLLFIVTALLPLCCTQFPNFGPPAAVPAPSAEDLASSLLPGAGLEFGFYAISCPVSDFVISSTVAEHLQRDPTIAAALLRMVFHDCFVQGCDASVLLASTEENIAEQDAIPNANSLRGFEVINDIKLKLEEACPNVVSCADILVLSARESLIHVGGPAYPLMTGRRDGVTSFAKLAEDTIPSPFDELQVTARRFQEQGFDLIDVVNLLGGHSIGRSRCRFFTPRLYNFSAAGLPDPRLSTDLLRSLVEICPPETVSGFESLASLDVGSELVFDNSYYKNLLLGQAILVVDQELTSSIDTSNLIRAYAENETAFFEGFLRSMIKLSNFKVVTGTEGQIRRNCSLVNPD